jgi:hypothetical protein
MTFIVYLRLAILEFGDVCEFECFDVFVILVFVLWSLRARSFALTVTWVILFPLLNFNDFNLYADLRVEQQCYTIGLYIQNNQSHKSWCDKLFLVPPLPK